MPKVTLAEHIRLSLEREILSGTLSPSVRIDEAGVASRMDCSRTPVREAFNQLVALGLLNRKSSHSGVTVSAISHSAIIEQVEACAELEACCAGLAARRMPAEQRAGLEGLTADPAALVEMVRNGCGNRPLADLATRQAHRIDPYRHLEGDLGPSRDRTAAQALARAIARGDGDLAARVVRQRLMILGRAAARRFRLPPDAS